MKSLPIKPLIISLCVLLLAACSNNKPQIPEPSAAERAQIEEIVIQTKRVDIATHLVQVFRPENVDIAPALWDEKVAELSAIDPVVEVLTKTENELNYSDDLLQRLKSLDVNQTLDAVAVIETTPKGYAIIRRIEGLSNQPAYELLFWSEDKLRATVQNLDLND